MSKFNSLEIENINKLILKYFWKQGIFLTKYKNLLNIHK